MELLLFSSMWGLHKKWMSFHDKKRGYHCFVPSTLIIGRAAAGCRALMPWLPQLTWHVEISQIYASPDPADSIPNILTLDKNHKNVKKLIFYRGCPTPEQAATRCINRQLDWGGHNSLEEPHSHYSQTPGARDADCLIPGLSVYPHLSDVVREY